MTLLQHPKIKELFDLLFETLLEESGRGAILIATAHAEDFLTELLNEVLPDEISKKQKNSILKGTFYSKINSAYAFRLINKKLADSLNSLRDIRNDAAHSSSKFELNELNERMKLVYNLGQEIPTMIKNMATELIIGSKVITLNEIFDKQSYTEEQKKAELMKMFEDPKNIEIVHKQLPYWELLTGICLICGLILNSKEKISKLKKGIKTWDNLLAKIERQ